MEKEAKALPNSFALHHARPNPFNPSTTIAYEVPEQTRITLTIYNLLGQEVVRLIDGMKAAGRYEVVVCAGLHGYGISEVLQVRCRSSCHPNLSDPSRG